MLFGITDIAVMVAIMIFHCFFNPLQDRGPSNVPPEMTELAHMLGAKRFHKLWKVQFPLIVPTIAVGLNLAFMALCFDMVIMNWAKDNKKLWAQSNIIKKVNWLEIKY